MYNRAEEILKYAAKDLRGIEIAPYFTPLAPKSQGWDVLTLDIADADTLRERASRDPAIAAHQIAQIETVDLLGSATEIAELVGEAGLASFDFVVSSHNFEHLPDPIRFLQGVGKVLKPQGMLSMAIPDKRACFDVFRRTSTLADWLMAYRERRARPTPEQIFDCESHFARCGIAGQPVAWLLDDSIENIDIEQEFSNVFHNYLQRINSGTPSNDYLDTHCSVLTPNTFRLLIEELGYLELINLKLIDVVQTGTAEFFAHLQYLTLQKTSSRSANAFAKYRRQLLQQYLNGE